MAAIKSKICLQPCNWSAPAGSLFLLTLLIIMLSIAGPVSAGQAEFKQTTCWFIVPKDRDMRCGHLVVPENRTKENGPVIKLAVVVFEPDRERHEAVVYLSGGPGQAARIESKGDIEEWWRFIDNGAWLRGRRLVVLDQRGAGLSEPSLNCSKHYSPEVWNGITSHPNDPLDFDLAQKREVEACRDDLIGKGIDLTAYNTSENAADIHDLRVALNIDKWVLFGISYGTKVALQVLEHHPQEVIAAVLDSTLPLDVNYVDHDAANLDRVLNKLDMDCAAHPGCLDSVGNLKALISQIVQQLDAQPILLRLKRDDQLTTFTRVSGADVLELIFNQFYDRGAIEMLPQLIRQTADQDYRSLAQMLSFYDVNEDSRAFADGMHLSVVCSDHMSPAAPPAKFALLDNWVRDNFYNWACPLWPSAKSVKPYGPRQRNEVPVLLLAGEYDPATPSNWAEDLARKMGRSQFVLFRGVGHDVIDATKCGGDVVADFLTNPEARIETSCVTEMSAPQFSIPEGDNIDALMTVSVLPSMLHR
jgi:pimeloyl-ACP methyl ester carboxylesterase